jgi:hypothetical protein
MRYVSLPESVTLRNDVDAPTTTRYTTPANETKNKPLRRKLGSVYATYIPL